MVKFKYLGITNENCMHEEIKIRLSPAIPATIQSCVHIKIKDYVRTMILPPVL